MLEALLLAAAISVGWSVWWLCRHNSPAKSLPGVPLVEFHGSNTRERYTSDASTLVAKGYEEHTKNGRPFCMRDFLNPHRPRLFLPIKYMDEVKNASQEKLSLPAILRNTTTLSKVGGPQITDELQISTRIDLNRALNKLIAPMQGLCLEAAEKGLQHYEEWNSVVLYPKILDLFSRMTARVMVGPDLCGAWPAVSMKYITRVLMAQDSIRKNYHPMLYWTAAYFDSKVALVNSARVEAAQLIRPVLEARKAEFAAADNTMGKHDDFIQWIMENYYATGKVATPDEIVQNIFVVMFASMHGTSFIALQSLFSILATPNAVDEIREEIARVEEKELCDSDKWTRHALGELRILDSFMKESLRLKPFQEATVQRVTMKSYTFKDGLKIPPGTVISFPNSSYNKDPSILGTDAGEFDGKRWFKRRAGFDASKFQFASTAVDMFDWGAGLHACPGRFMADVTIKLILICLIKKYEMKLPEGMESLDQKKRFMDTSPDTSVPIMLRSL